MKKMLLVMLVVCCVGCSNEPSPCDGPYKISERHPHVEIVWPNGNKQKVCCTKFMYGRMGTGGIFGSSENDFACRIIYMQGGGTIVFRDGSFCWWWSEPHK